MALTTSTDDLNIIAALDDEPNDVGGLSAAELKATFDESGLALQEYINTVLIPELDAEHLPYVYGSATTIKETIESVVAGVIPDESVTAAKLADDAVTENKIADGAVTADKLSSDALSSVRDESLLRDLKIMLNLALKTTTADAWADLLADSTGLDATAVDSSYTVSGGKVVADTTSAIASQFGYLTKSANFGNNATYKVAQTFSVNHTSLSKVNVRLKSSSSTQTDHVILKIVTTSGGLPTDTVVATSENTIDPDDEAETGTDYDFTFAENVSITPNTTYAFVLERTGSQDASKYYIAMGASSGTYDNGVYCGNTSSGWTAQAGADLHFDIYKNDGGTVTWLPVTAEEAPIAVAVSASETLNAGSLTYYMSDDGSTWTEITALDTSQAVSFEGTSVYLKVVITEDAALNGIAWGGY